MGPTGNPPRTVFKISLDGNDTPISSEDFEQLATAMRDGSKLVKLDGEKLILENKSTFHGIEKLFNKISQ